MAETPDFDEIARQLAVNHADRQNIDGLDALTQIVEAAQQLRLATAEQLRQVWNARGAADLDAMEMAHENYSWTELEDRIRGLDR